MNKKYILITLTALLISIINLNIYNISSRKLKEEISYFTKFKEKAKEYIFLKRKLSQNALKTLPKNCQIEKGKIMCNIKKSQLYKISDFLKLSYKIKNFEIKDNNSSIVFNGAIEE
ncbi:MAG: hypothetical protein ABGX26_03720 [Nautiliaceae bacterium]